MTVDVVQEDVLATITAVHEVVDGARELDSWLAGHSPTFNLRAKLRKGEINSLRTDPFFKFPVLEGESLASSLSII